MMAEIDAAFKVKGKPVIFAWGDKIYAPVDRGELSKALYAHEAVHGERQRRFPGGVEAWWRRYIADPAFRLAEEIPAHKAELAVMLAKAKGPSMKRHALSVVARKLASPLYGGTNDRQTPLGLITIADAKKVLS